MRLQVKGRNLEVTDSIRTYAEQKLKKLDKQLNDATEVELELAVEKNPSIAASHVAEATIWTKGPVLRAKEASTDMRASIDLLVDKLERQVTRYREKRQRRNARGSGGVAAQVDLPPLSVDDVEEELIVKTKQFAVSELSAEEAVLRLELVGHDFFVFQNAESDGINVVYRRRDGNYGLIEPQAG